MEIEGKPNHESPEPSPSPEEELAVYEKLRQRVSKGLAELYDRINADSISQVMDKAATELREIGGHSKEAIANAVGILKKDIVSTGAYVKPKLDEVSGDAKKSFDSWRDKGGELWREISQEAEYLMALSRDKGGGFLASAAKGLGDWSQSVAEKLDVSLTYKTGEVTHGGEFSCLNCGGNIVLKQPGRLPPCPKCSKTGFRRA